MASITYLRPDGESTTVEVSDGVSIMRAALTNDIDGIVGECGGQAMCATCHVYVKNAPDLHEVADDEDEMLECTADERLPNSRLRRQVKAGVHFKELTVPRPPPQIH